ncbi:hypothetical protein FGO68_gene3116 [Halteria grandinella]|uniref:Uncharacterized protein n=1 Tax=Halteria grandinella TaxID=5974 RepID=A0A8J8P448_HALGN|nr:hypothetical protein FGO68_gene3116 [Halteria grandinella]
MSFTYNPKDVDTLERFDHAKTSALEQDNVVFNPKTFTFEKKQYGSDLNPTNGSKLFLKNATGLMRRGQEILNQIETASRNASNHVTVIIEKVKKKVSKFSNMMKDVEKGNKAIKEQIEKYSHASNKRLCSRV